MRLFSIICQTSRMMGDTGFVLNTFSALEWEQNLTDAPHYGHHIPERHVTVYCDV